MTSAKIQDEIATGIETSAVRIMSELYNHGNLNRAALAGARGAATISSPRAQKVWPLIMSQLEKLDTTIRQEAPKAKILSISGTPTNVETALYTAIHFYAIHQQGSDRVEFGNSRRGNGATFFTALAQLRNVQGMRDSLDRRIDALLGMTNIHGVINALAHLVGILKAKYTGPQIDYPRLAKDLFVFQEGYISANATRLQWGQEYY
ncbi:type I-E CRISPR-associated protein Cse2/CasB [Lentilactobacillus raoultii]|uniref:Type I-E CRISPR-associated protein Cse2/CasB n=1 Tax=Lentilactobacillus raoultii TaxID=1987503 RepID=A0ABW3PGW6_9LACO|nr:type I-E CRISPR-associated protein Cse2/CasB [Lentilactobacillus raoultii]